MGGRRARGAALEAAVRARNETRGSVHAENVEWAGTSESRRQGLLGRSSMDVGEGIYLVPCKWIHMFGMKFPIDVAFLNSSGRILAVHHSLSPNRLSRPVLRAEGALELPATTLRKTGTRVGDQVLLTPESHA